GDRVDPAHLSACADLLMTTSPNVMVYAAMDGWRRQMVEHGHELLSRALDLAEQVRGEIADIPDVQVMESELLGAEASHDLDRLQVLVDISQTGTSGYQASDWLREHKQLDLGLSDHRRFLATMSIADRDLTVERLLGSLSAWRAAA
ncbi:ornithine decarboxylase, partial [Mycobacteroides abscessus subsp. massiliense]